MPNYLDIETALQSHLKSVPGIPEIVWPNTLAEFDADETYVGSQNITVTPVPIGIADDDSLRVDGFYQVDVYVPRDSGVGRAMEVINSITEYFNRGGEIQTDDGDIRFKYSSVESGNSTGAHFHVILLIHYVIITI